MIFDDRERFYSSCLKKKQGLIEIILLTAILYNLFCITFKQG